MNKNIIPVAAILAAAAPVQMNAQAQQNLDEAVAAIQSAINVATATIDGDEYEGEDYATLRKESKEALEAINKKLADEVTDNSSDPTYSPIVANYQAEIDAVLAKAAADKKAIIKDKAETAALEKQNAALKDLKDNWTAVQKTVNAMDPSPKAEACHEAESLKADEQAIKDAIAAIKPVKEDADVEANNKTIMDAIKAAQALVDKYSTNAAAAKAEYDNYLAISADIEESQAAYNQAVQDLVKALGNEDDNFSKAQGELTNILKDIKAARDENNNSYNETGKTTASFDKADINAQIAAIVKKYTEDREAYDGANDAISEAEETFTDFNATLVNGETDFNAVKLAIESVNDAIKAAKEANEKQYAAQTINANSEVDDALAAIATAQTALEEVSARAKEILDIYDAQTELVAEVSAAKDEAVAAVAKLVKDANEYVDEYNAAEQFANTETDLNQKIDAASPLPGYENSVAHSYDVALDADKQAPTLTMSQVEGIAWDKADLEAQIAKYQKDAETAIKLYVQAAAVVKVHEAKYAEVAKTYNEMGEYSVKGDYNYEPTVKLKETLDEIRKEISDLEKELNDILKVDSKRYNDAAGNLLKGTDRDAKHFDDLNNIDLKVKKITDELNQLKKDVAAEKHAYDQAKLKYLVDREHELVDIKMDEMDGKNPKGWTVPADCIGHECYAATVEAYDLVTDSIAKIHDNYEKYPAFDTEDPEKYEQEHLDMLIELLKAIDSVIGDNGLCSKFEDAKAKAEDEVADDKTTYTSLNDKIKTVQANLKTLKDSKKLHADVKALHTTDLENAQKAIDDLKDALEASNTAHTVRTDAAGKDGFDAKVTEISTTVGNLTTCLNQDQANYTAHNALLKTAGDVSAEYDKVLDISSEWVQPYKDELAKQKDALDNIVDGIGTFDHDCTCSADKDPLDGQLKNIVDVIKGLDAKNTANAEAYAAQQKDIDEVQALWNDINDLINTNSDWEHPELLAAALKEMAGYQIALNDIKDAAEDAWMNAKAAESDIEGDLVELAKSINSVPNKLMGTYIKQVDEDNAVRYGQFTDAIAETQAAFANAIDVADNLRAIDGLSESASKIAKEAATLHDEIFGLSGDIRNLVEEAKESYIGTHPENDKRVEPNIYDEEGYADTDKSYEAQANALTQKINDKLDAFYATVDAAAKEVINDEAVKAADKVYAAGAKIDRLNVDEEILETLFDEATELIAAEKESALAAEHPSEELTVYLEALDGELNAAIKNGLNTAAACDIEHFFEEVDEAIAEYEADIKACEALTDAQKEAIDQKYQDEFASKYDAAVAAFNSSKTDKTTFDELDNIKAILDGYQDALDAIVDEAQEQNDDNIADADNTAAYDRMMAAAQKLADKCAEVLTTIQEDCAHVADSYKETVLRYQATANNMLGENGALAYEKNARSAVYAENNMYGGFDAKADKWTGYTYFGSIQYYYNLIVNAENSAKAEEKNYAEGETKQLAEDIKALEEMYNKIAAADWEDAEPDEYKKEIDDIKKALDKIDTSDDIDKDVIAAINKAKDDVAKEYTKLADVLDANASTTAYNNLIAALGEVKDQMESEDYDERLSKYYKEQLNKAHEAVEAVEAEIEAAAAKPNPTITYDEKALAEKIEKAKDQLDAAESNAQAETEAWAASDAQAETNKDAFEAVQAALDDLTKTIAGYNEQVQDDYEWQLQNIQQNIDYWNAENETFKQYNSYGRDLTNVAESLTSEIKSIAIEAGELQAEYANADAFDSLLKAKNGLWDQYNELSSLVRQWFNRTGLQFSNLSGFSAQIDDINIDIWDSYYNEMADDNKDAINAAIVGVQQELADALEAENAAIAAWKAQYNRKGDVNRDGDIDILDYGKVASWIINGMDTEDAFENPADFYLANTTYDEYGDSQLTTSDLQYIINQIKKFYKNGAYDEVLSVKGERIGADKVTVVNNNGQLAIGVDNSVAYTGFQMDITLPSGASIENIALTARANGQSVSFNNLGGDTYRVLVMGIDGEAFNGNSGAIINVATNNLHGTVGISNIHFTDQMANSYSPALAGEATAIEGVMAEQSMTEKIYSVGGQLLNKAQKGVNIIMNNGVVKKVLNK